jgi:hypothetical protein
MDNLPQNEPKQTASDVGASFDYDSVPDHADTLRAIADRVHGLSTRVTKSTVDIGLELEAGRALLKNGPFGRWVRAEFDFTIRSAQQKIAAARFVRDEGEIFSRLPITALYALAETSTPAEVVETVRARLAKGEVLRAHQVKTVIANAQATSAQNATVPGSEVPPPRDDEPAVPQTERSQPAAAMATSTESTVASIEQTESETERAEPPTAQLSPPQQATDFSLEMGMRQLIEVLLDVVLGNKSITEHAQTITGLFTDCHLETLTDRLTNSLQGTARAPEPAASDHVTVVSSSPPSDDRRADSASEGSARAAEPEPEHSHASTPSTAQPKPAERPAPPQGSPREPTEFELEPGVRDLIDALMGVILGNRSITEQDVTQISGLAGYCHHRPLADQLTSFWNDSTRSSRPDADNHATIVWSVPGTADMIKPGVDTILIARRGASGEIVLHRGLTAEERAQRVKVRQDARDAERRLLVGPA